VLPIFVWLVLVEWVKKKLGISHRPTQTDADR
jgi:hypothetical protein